MRSIAILVFACACALASGYYQTKDFKEADADFLVKQKAFFEVFQHIHQNEVFHKLYDEYKDFDIMGFREFYTKTEYFDEFWRLYKFGMLGMNEVFLIAEPTHLKEVIALFKLFYYAKDWTTFYKTMMWARFHINEGQFIYALTAAVIHRHDMAGIVLPAPYEIYPYYFFDSEVIQKAQHYKMQGFYGFKKIEDVYTVTIPANYSGWHVYTSDEQKLSYFTEDIGLNSYYYYFHMDYPFWMGGEEFGLKNDRRGEFYFYQYQQFLSRYYLERLSNGLGEIPQLSYYMPIETGYYPALRYFNGEFFPTRDNNYVVYNKFNYYDVEMVEDYERRLRDSIDFGYFKTLDGTQLDFTKYEFVEFLGNFFQGNADSKFPRFFGQLVGDAKRLFGAPIEHVEHKHVIPSVLEHFETAMRDPVFYQMFKRWLTLFYRFKEHFPAYTYDELNFKGVKIETVEMDKLITYFEKFDADITNVADIELYDEKMTYSDLYKHGRLSNHHGSDFVINARQWRLNHVPFKFKIFVNSDKAQKAIVKLFIGPKYDEFGHLYNIQDNAENFYELDHFLVELNEGKTTIERSSEDFSWFVKDRTTYYELYKKLMLSIKGEYKFPLDMSEAHCGFPSRLMLPKGKKGGMPFQFFYMIAPYYAPKLERFTGYDSKLSCGIGSGARYLDTLPFGYPFNRPIDETQWFTPNMYMYNTVISFKPQGDGFF